MPILQPRALVLTLLLLLTEDRIASLPGLLISAGLRLPACLTDGALALGQSPSLRTSKGRLVLEISSLLHSSPCLHCGFPSRRVRPRHSFPVASDRKSEEQRTCREGRAMLECALSPVDFPLVHFSSRDARRRKLLLLQRPSSSGESNGAQKRREESLGTKREGSRALKERRLQRGRRRTRRAWRRRRAGRRPSRAPSCPSPRSRRRPSPAGRRRCLSSKFLCQVRGGSSSRRRIAGEKGHLGVQIQSEQEFSQLYQLFADEILGSGQVL